MHLAYIDVQRYCMNIMRCITAFINFNGLDFLILTPTRSRDVFGRRARPILRSLPVLWATRLSSLANLFMLHIQTTIANGINSTRSDALEARSVRLVAAGVRFLAGHAAAWVSEALMHLGRGRASKGFRCLWPRLAWNFIYRVGLKRSVARCRAGRVGLCGEFWRGVVADLNSRLVLFCVLVGCLRCSIQTGASPTCPFGSLWL